MSGRLVKFISWNINGCGSPAKRKKVLGTYLKNNQADIVFIQESHMKGKEAEKFKAGWVGHIFHSSYSSKRNGVIILIHKNISFVLLKQRNDSEGWILCLEAIVEGTKMVLCNIYAPNKSDPPFFYELNHMLGNSEGQIILAGDGNGSNSR